MPSKSQKQHNFMEAIAHDPRFARKTGVPASVGKDFVAADKRKYAQGGPVSKRLEMEHRTGAADQTARDNPLTGSALKALVRGWIAGTAGMPGDLEGLVRAGINKSFGAGGVNVDAHPVLPTSEFYKEWLPGKQVGDEAVTEAGSLFGGVGATKPGKLAMGALSRAAEAAPGPLAGSLAAQRGVIKAPGGNWLSGSVEDALKGLKAPMRRPERVGPDVITDDIWNAYLKDSPDQALNQFIDKQLTRYVKNDMATERDPIRALAEQGVLHVNPEQLNFRPETHGKYLEEGQTAVAKSPAAKAWEGSSDLKVFKNKAGDFVSGDSWIPDTNATSNTVQKNPWLVKVAPETDVHGVAEPRALPADLGFDHLIDELRNATNPNSGLPQHLLLDPASLNRVSVPQAVQRVADINAWREAQKAEANSKIANNAATVLHKEYPDAATNPKGLRWVELKAVERTSDNVPASMKAEYEYQLSRGLTPDQALLEIKRDIGHPELADALKYEGDTMGHCVGGYCGDVANGSSRIFSLRDAKGQPHVTIETAPSGSNKVSDLQAGTPTDYNIIQIKGKANRKPNDEYLPFVQDFVKSGNWPDVGDLQNTGLVHKNQFPMINDTDVALPEGQTYFTLDEIRKLRPDANLPQGYADGGAVAPMRFWDDSTPTETNGVDPNAGGWDSIPAPKQPTIDATRTPAQSLAQYLKDNAQFINSDGTVKAPEQGGYYLASGQNAADYYKNNIGQRMDSHGWDSDPTPGVFNDSLSLAWQPGVTDSGGFLGGLTHFAGQVLSLPPISMALSAGLAPMIGEGLQGLGVAADTAKTVAPLVTSAAKTAVAGGDLGDIAKSAGATYLGNEVGGEVTGATGSDFAGKAANTLTQAGVRGNLSGATLDSLAAQYAAGTLTDLSGLPPQAAQIVVNLAKNRRVSPIGALTTAMNAVGSPQLARSAAGG